MLEANDKDDESSDNEGQNFAADDEDSSSGVDEVWQLSDEQRDYYRQQFRQISQEPSGHLSGPVAKAFFERSRLPSVELSKIWQLSDVDKDGALNIDEFCIAMHLVVLRRNSVDLPTHLPPKLRIQAFRSNSGPVSGRVAELFRTRSLEQPQVRHMSSKTNKLIRTNSKKWTQFNSPTQDLLLDTNTPPVDMVLPSAPPVAIINSVLSPPDSAQSTKLANFDFQASAVERDPKILHPIALRVSPQVNSGTSGDPLKQSTPLATFPTNGSATTIHSSSSNTSTNSNKKLDPPPPPPPRPQRRVMGHARSSSLDLNHLVKGCVTSSTSSAMKSCPTNNPTLSAHTGGAFTAYKKGLANTIRSRFAAVPPDVRLDTL